MTTQGSGNKQLIATGQLDTFGYALAHVLVDKDQHDVLLGQAWIVGKDTLVTCGHVVDEYTRNPGSLTVKFPTSGNRYVVQGIRLHPSFKREQDRVFFDISVLNVELREPESSAGPLPVIYDKELELGKIVGIRFPANFDQLTTSFLPIVQFGEYIGRIKKSDRFHLRHQVALTPGDSGTPLFDGESIVAIHCGGDTLPGLNIPASSIRDALSIDALMALNVPESSPARNQSMSSGITAALISFILAGLIGFFATAAFLVAPDMNRWKIDKAGSSLSVRITFDKPFKKYRYGDEVRITIRPDQDCYLYVYYIQGKYVLALNPPPQTQMPAQISFGQALSIPHMGPFKYKIDDTPGGKFHLVALKNDTPPVSKEELDKADPEQCLLEVSPEELLNRIQKLKDKSPGQVMHWQFDAPVANKGDGR